jgi:HemY protein
MQCLEQAALEFPTTRSTVNSLKAQLLYKSDQLEQCLAVLEQSKKISVNDATLLRLLKEVYVKLEDWKNLGELIPSLKKLKVIDPQELERIQTRVFMEELYAAFDAGIAKPSEQGVVADIEKVWKKASASHKEDEKIVKHYSELLLKANEKAMAAKVIETALTKRWSDALAIIYGEVDFGSSPQQLIMAEGWLKGRPANASLLLSLGRICMRNELWGKAKEYYEASIKISPSADAYGELSRLLKSLGEHEASDAYLKNYGDLIGAELPELPMPGNPTLSQARH